MKKTLLTLLVLLFAVKGFSCSCVDPGKINDEQFKSYSLVVMGRIEKVVEGNFIRTIHIKVEKRYKGILNSGVVIVSTPSQSGMCGIFPTVGETWLVFATKARDSYSTDLCTRTKNMNPQGSNYAKEEIENDLKYLESKSKQH